MPRRPASGQATPVNTNDTTLRPRTNPMAHTPAPVNRHSTTIHSASLTSTTSDSARHSAAQARVNGSRRFRLAVSSSAPAAISTRKTPSPWSRNGISAPASTPTPNAPSSTRTLPGTPSSGQKSPNVKSVRDGGGLVIRREAVAQRGPSRRSSRTSGSPSGVRMWGCAGGRPGRVRRTRRAPDSRSRSIPPCRSVTHRAIARPRPVPPPPSVSLSVPNRSKARSRCAGATPGPWSATTRCQ